MVNSVQYAWERFWSPVGTPYSLDYLGFPSYQSFDPIDTDNRSVTKTLAQLDTERCLVLIGDPSAGKSTAYREVQHGERIKVIKKSLGDVDSASRFFDDLEADTKTDADQYDKIIIYLDSLDEGLLITNTLLISLSKWLEKLGDKKSPDPVFEKLYLRFTCRSVVWRSQEKVTLQRLQNIFGEGHVKVYELYPLRLKEIIIAATSRSLNGNDLIQKIRETQTQNFCLDPKSLNALLDAYQEDKISGGIEKTELYEQLLLNKCKDPNITFDSQKLLTTQQRFRFASRIAAYCLLANKTTISIDDQSQQTTTDITIDELIRDEFTLDDRKEILAGKKEVIEVINTSLFTLDIDPSKFRFGHRGDLEFLAAWHLSKLELNTTLISQLITSPFDNLKIIPQLEEAVVWLCTFNKSLFDLLTDTEPRIVMRCEREFTATERNRIVTSLLTRAATMEIVDAPIDESHYRKLNFTGIEAIIKKNLKPTSNVVLKRIAIHMVGQCKVVSLAPVLLDILHDENNNTSPRREAMESLIMLDNEKNIPEIKSYATQPHADDPDDEIKGAALRYMYPNHLSTLELLSALTPVKRDNLYGAYQGFLDTVVDMIPDKDIKLALEYIQKNQSSPRHFDHGPFERFREQIIQRSYTLFEQDEILSLAANIILVDVRHHERIDPPTQDASRVKLAKRIIETLPTGMHYFNLFHPTTLIVPSDWKWLSEMARTVSSEETRTIIIQLLAHIYERGNARMTDELLELATSLKINKSVSYLTDAIEIDSDLAQSLRNSLQKPETRRHEKREKRNLNADLKALNEMLVSLKSGKADTWWRLVTGLVADFEFDITKSRYWENFGALNEQALEEGAVSYLNAYVPTNKFDRLDLTGYKAILYLKTRNNKLVEQYGDDFWRTWTYVILYASLVNSENDLNNDQKYFVMKVYELDRQAAIDFVIQQFRETTSPTHNIGIYSLHKIKFLLDTDFVKAAWSLLIDSTIIGKDFIGELLFERQPEISIEVVQTIVTPYLTEKISPERKSDTELVLSYILKHATGKTWFDYWKLFNKHKKKGHGVITRTLAKDTFGPESKIYRKANSIKAELLKWVLVNYPGLDFPRQGGFRPADSQDLYYFKSNMVRSLIDNGSTDAVQALRKISSELPKDEDLMYWVTKARESMRRNTWEPVTVQQLRELLHHQEKRLIRSDRELSEIILESLHRLEKKLQGENATAHFLWDTTLKKPKRTPKDENTLSDFVKMHLYYDLYERGIIVNREVEIRKSTGKKDGERTDIYVQATREVGDKKEIISVVIESKRCYHPDVDYAMETQLKNRYLRKHRSASGIYLIGWYYCDYLKEPKRIGGFKKFNIKFEKQAEQLSDAEIQIKHTMLDCSI